MYQYKFTKLHIKLVKWNSVLKWRKD